MTQQLYCIKAHNYRSEYFNYILLFSNSAIKQTLKRGNKDESIELETRICEFCFIILDANYGFSRLFLSIIILGKRPNIVL